MKKVNTNLIAAYTESLIINRLGKYFKVMLADDERSSDKLLTITFSAGRMKDLTTYNRVTISNEVFEQSSGQVLNNLVEANLTSVIEHIQDAVNKKYKRKKTKSGSSRSL